MVFYLQPKPSFRKDEATHPVLAHYIRSPDGMIFAKDLQNGRVSTCIDLYLHQWCAMNIVHRAMKIEVLIGVFQYYVNED